MRYLLLLATLATPVALHGQERSGDETPIMAAAVKYMQQFYGGGVPGFEVAPKHRRFDLRLAASHYVIEPREVRPNGVRPARVPRRTAPQDSLLLRQLASAVALDTVTVEHAVVACLPFMVPRRGKGSENYRNCRFTTIEGVLGASLPVIVGDTATVEIWAWVNALHPRYPEYIDEELWVVTLVRDRSGWRVTQHARGDTWVS